MRTHAQRVERVRARLRDEQKALADRFILERITKAEYLEGFAKIKQKLDNAESRAARDLSRKEKDEVLAEAGAWCEYCKKKAAWVVDHVIPVCRGGTSDRDNLKGACKLCNADKLDLTVDEWRETRLDEGRSWPPDWDAEIAADLGLPSLIPAPEQRERILAVLDREFLERQASQAT